MTPFRALYSWANSLLFKYPPRLITAGLDLTNARECMKRVLNKQHLHGVDSIHPLRMISPFDPLKIQLHNNIPFSRRIGNFSNQIEHFSRQIEHSSKPKTFEIKAIPPKLK